MAAEQFAEIEIPALGMDTDTVPRLLDRRKAPLLKNFLMDRPGVLPMRGPLCEGSAWDAGAGIGPVAQWAFDDKVLVSRYASVIQPPDTLSAVLAAGGSLTPAQAYFYKVTALNASGETTPTVEVTKTARDAPAAPANNRVLGQSSNSGFTTTAGTYYYKVIAFNNEAFSGVSAETSFTAPVGAGSGSSVTLGWDSVPGATKYRVYRGTTPGGEDRWVETTFTSLVDRPIDATTSFGQTWTAAAPSAATNFESVQLTWSAVAGATGYRVYRGTASGSENVFFAPGNVLTFTDTGAAGTAGTPPTSSSATSGGRDAWVAPYRRAATAGLLRPLSAALKVVDLLNNSVSNLTAATADGVPGLRSTRVGPFVYGHAGDATATVTQNGAVYKKTKLLRWDGSALPVAYTNGPQAAQDIIYHYNRLFVLGGIPQGGTVIGFNSLFWTDPMATDGSFLPDTVAAWQDDVSGLTNQLVVGTDDGSDFGVALARVGGNLLILKRRSLWMLYGSSPSNFVIKRVADSGCLDPRSVVEFDDGVFFMSDVGFRYFDGSQLSDASSGLQSTLVTNARAQVGRTGLDGGYARATRIGGAYILVTTGAVASASLASTADTDAWLLHVPTRAWTQLSSGAVPSVVGAGQTLNHTYLLSDTKVFRANYLLNPQAAPANFRGLDSVDGSVTNFLIPSRWLTRTLSLATPALKSQLAQLIAEYYWSLANGGWLVTATCRGEQGVVTPSGTLPAPVVIAASLPARGRIELSHETDELYLDIAAAASSPAPFTAAELHRMVIESRPTHRVKATL